MLRKFKTIDLFKLNLGMNLKGAIPLKPGEERPIKIKDEFIKKYQTITNRIITSYGSIGSLKFYEDTQLPLNEWCVYDKGLVYEIVVSPKEYEMDIKEYLSTQLKNIEELSNSDKPVDDLVPNGIKKDVIYTSMPEDVERPDSALPKDQYIQEMVNRRKELDKRTGLFEK